MKQFFHLFALIVFIIACKSETKPIGRQIFKIDTAIAKKAAAEISDVDSNYMDFMGGFQAKYNFASHVKADFFVNDTLESRIDTLIYGLESYYYWDRDTFNLIVHYSRFSTNAFCIKIFGDSVYVKYLKAPHENASLYRLQLTDSSTEGVEVPCIHYELIISKTPDSAFKQTVFGYFSFKSASFYRWYNGQYSESDWAYYHQKLRTNMAFYFRSNYKKPWWK